MVLPGGSARLAGLVSRATVVVVTWQGAELLGPCLDALSSQTTGCRVLVVDNASTDGTAQLLARRKGIEVLRSPANVGFAGGANLALRRVTTPYAAVLNDDARPDADWLEHLLEGFAKDVGAVTSKVLLEPRYVAVSSPCPREVAKVTVDGKDVSTRVVRDASRLLVPITDGRNVSVLGKSANGAVLFERQVSHLEPRLDLLNSTGGMLTPTGHGADRGYLEVDEGQYDAEVEVFAVCGAAAAFRTEVAAGLGWFDPWYFAYYEDLDLSWRIRRAGWRVAYAPNARVRHHHAATSHVGSDLFLFHNRRNRLATLLRNASARELAGFAVRSARPRPEDPGDSLVNQPVGTVRTSEMRGRWAALTSFVRHAPKLLIGRIRERRLLRALRPTSTS